nr:hypothetical protein [Tanacetum cinerariifolium]
MGGSGPLSSPRFTSKGEDLGSTSIEVPIVSSTSFRLKAKGTFPYKRELDLTVTKSRTSVLLKGPSPIIISRGTSIRVQECSPKKPTRGTFKSTLSDLIEAPDTDSCRVRGLRESDSIWTCRVTVYFLVEGEVVRNFLIPSRLPRSLLGFWTEFLLRSKYKSSPSNPCEQMTCHENCLFLHTNGTLEENTKKAVRRTRGAHLLEDRGLPAHCHPRCSWCGGPFNSGNFQRCTNESTTPLNEIVSQIPLFIVITTSPPVLPIEDPKHSLIMDNEDLNTIPKKESDEIIKSSVEDFVLIPSESEDTSGSDSKCDLPSCDDFSPINIPEGKSVTFSNPLFDSNDDFTSSDDESLSDEDVLKDNVKIYSNPLFEFDDEYISSDVNPLFDEVLKDFESKASYDSNLGEPALLVAPFFDANEDECFDPRGNNFPKCGNPVDGYYCQGCALLRKKFKEDLFTYCIENGILQDSSAPSNDNTNVVNALQEPFVVKQDPGKNSSQSPPQINHHCCYGCGDSLEEIFCHQCTCELCGRGANHGYNCPLKVSVVSNPEPCHNQNVDELPQTVPSFDPTCYREDGNSFTYDSTSNLVHKSPNVFDPPLQPLIYLYEFCGDDAYYSHDCLLQFPVIHRPIREKTCAELLAKEQEDRPSVCYYDDDDEDYAIAVTPILSIEEPDNSLNDILREKLLNINLLIAKIEALKDNPTPSSDFMTKSSSTSLNSLLEETNTLDNSLPEFETFCFDLEEISSGSTTTRSDIFLLNYEVFYDDHVKEISSGSTTTHFYSSLYDSFIFDLSINLFPPADRSDFYQFTDELAHIISPPKYNCFCFKNEPNSGDFTMDVVEDIFPTREPRIHVHNALPTHPTRQLNLDFILSSESLFAYVVWIFLLFLSYSVAP